MRVRKLTQAADDGYRNELVPGVKASADAERLAAELAFATARLAELAADPPGIYAQIGAEPDPEEALWLAFLTAYLSPTDGRRSVRRDPRGARAVGVAASCPTSTSRSACARRTTRRPGTRTVLAYRAWATRAGGQQAAFAGEGSWTPERRFDRLFERLAVQGFGRPGRYELLVSLGRLGVVDVRPSTLQLTDDATTVAAKRVFGIGDKMLLERRARELADAVEAADRGARSRAVQLGGAAARPRDDGLDASTPSDDERSAIAAVLGV